jgi:hypothetical protein
MRSCHLRTHAAATAATRIYRLQLGQWKAWNEWKERVVIAVRKHGDKTGCSNYRGISLLSTSYKILSNILLSRLSPYIDKIIGDHQCGFRCN